MLTRKQKSDFICSEATLNRESEKKKTPTRRINISLHVAVLLRHWTVISCHSCQENHSQRLCSIIFLLIQTSLNKASAIFTWKTNPSTDMRFVSIGVPLEKQLAVLEVMVIHCLPPQVFSFRRHHDSINVPIFVLVVAQVQDGELL
jgi:hypothetical protein